MIGRIRKYKLKAGGGPEMISLETYLKDDPAFKVGTQLHLEHSPFLWEITDVATESEFVHQADRIYHD